MNVKFLKNEYWYGGAVHYGVKMPASEKSDFTIDLVRGDGICDQFSSMFISNKGRYIISAKPFIIHFDKGIIRITGHEELEVGSGYKNLKGAMLAAGEKLFEKNAGIPDELFFRVPQYNTWIELMYNQNQKQILEYAHTLINEGMKPGIIMIDEGWSPDYGDYDFCKRKFPNPKEMVEELHEMGFKVMLWITPIVSPDSDCFRSLRNTDLLIKDNTGEFAIRKWWNGFSTVLDLSNPKACEWLDGKLKFIMDKYGIDGFKFDSGDSYLYRKDDNTFKIQQPSEHTRDFNDFCVKYRFNELRSVFNGGAKPIVCRLQDKSASWIDEYGIRAIIPNMLTQGLLGYFYGCPDMIGGGSYSSFLKPGFQIDEELYLRWLEASLLCPMLQFSLSPKRVLSKKSFETVMRLLQLREKYVEYIIELAKKASVNFEPIIRLMEYEYPDCGYEKVDDQFMLGDKFLIAPVIRKGEFKRKVLLPKGSRWMENGEIFDGGCEVTVSCETDKLIIFQKV